jgi:hypothetical protein
MVYLHTPKKQFWYILEGLGIEYVDPFFGHLVYFTGIATLRVVTIE